MIKVEFSTKEEWLEARKSCLTGTTVGEHIGIVSPYAPKTPQEMEKSPAVIFGKNCETSILTIFKNLPEIAKQTLVEPTIMHTLWYSDYDPRIAGSFDALAWEKGMEGFCECKSTGAGLYDLKNRVIPDTTWLQILHYFTINPNFQFCYLVVCDYPQFGNRSVKIDWLRISRQEVQDRITNLQGWRAYLLAKGVR